MVTERPLSPQCVGREFVRQYYTLLNEAPAHLHRFYNNNSSFIHGGLDSHNRETVAVIGQRNIHQRIQQLSFRDCHTKITQVDSQATLGDGVVVQVSGELSNAGQPMRRFNQTFVLAPQNPKKYYVHNDIFRYQDMLTDEDIEGEMARSEAEEDQENEVPQNDIHQPESQQAGGVTYYTGMTQVVNGTSEPSVHEEPISAAPVPVPQPEPMPQQITISPIEMIPQPLVSPQEPAPTVTQAPYIVTDVPPNQMDQEEQQYHNQINQQQSHPSPPQPQQLETGNEPKTYATLVKSGGQLGGVPSVYYNNTASNPIQSVPPPVSPPPVNNEKIEMRQQNHQAHKPPVQNMDQQRNNFSSAPRQQSSSDDNGNYSGGADGDRRRGNQYSDSRNSQFPDSHQLFIGNLPAGQTEEQFKIFFSRKFGPVANVKILQKSNKKDYGFVTFEDLSTVQIVLNAKPIKYPNENGEEINVEEKKIRRVGGGGEGGGRGGPRGGGGGVMRPIMGGPPRGGGGGPGRGMRSFNPNNNNRR